MAVHDEIDSVKDWLKAGEDYKVRFPVVRVASGEIQPMKGHVTAYIPSVFTFCFFIIQFLFYFILTFKGLFDQLLWPPRVPFVYRSVGNPVWGIGLAIELLIVGQ